MKAAIDPSSAGNFASDTEAHWDANILLQLAQSANAEIRAYQLRATGNAIQAFLSNRKAVLLNSPTGSGKTYCGLLAARYMQQLFPDCGVGWVAMRRNLLHQVCEMNERLQLGVKGLQPISMFNANPPKFDRDGRPIRMLVLDECFPAETVVDCLVAGKPMRLPIKEVVEGRAEKALAKSSDGRLRYSQIISRTKMGRKRIWNIKIRFDGETKTLRITELGRVLTGRGYVRTKDLLLGDRVSKLARWCQTKLFSAGVAGVPIHPTFPLVQAEALSPALDYGVIVSVEPTDEIVETYDLGIETDHNFFADGVLVHNCHHQAVSSMMHLYDVIQPDWDLGLTATPFRTDAMRLTYQTVIRDISIQQLIEQKYLSPYHLYIIDAWTPENVAMTYLREPERWGQSVFFWHTREQAQECVERLRAGGMRTELVTAESDRERQLDEFEEGKVDCLVNMLILTEGFDCSRLRTVFVRDSQRGPTIQMAGRVFRKHPGIDHKNLVQSQATHWPFSRTADPLYTYTWKDNLWRSHKLSPEIEQVATRALLLMAQSDVRLPDWMIKKQQQGKRMRHHRIEPGARLI